MPNLKLYLLCLIFSLAAQLTLSPLIAASRAESTGWLAAPSSLSTALSLQGFTGAQYP